MLAMPRNHNRTTLVLQAVRSLPDPRLTDLGIQHQSSWARQRQFSASDTDWMLARKMNFSILLSDFAFVIPGRGFWRTMLWVAPFPLDLRRNIIRKIASLLETRHLKEARLQFI
jgi:hypothetical protein